MAGKNATKTHGRHGRRPKTKRYRDLNQHQRNKIKRISKSSKTLAAIRAKEHNLTGWARSKGYIE